MTEIVKLLKRGESEKIEFKLSLSQMNKIMESISAFSNTNVGTIVIGVSDKRKVVGADIGERTIENLANRIKQNTDPTVYPSIHVKEVNDKHVVVIEVEESEQKPVLAFGRAYKRVGKSNQKLGYEYLEQLGLNERQKKAITYLKEHGKIDRKTYCNICGVGKTVAHEELADMVNKELIEMVGKGRGVYYILRMKRTISGQLADN